MNRLSRLPLAALAFVLLCASLTSIAHAELLQRLHVLNFTIDSDTKHPRVGVPFHVTVTIHARERIMQPQYVYQPTFPGLEKLADQHTLSYVNGGSIYRETLTLVANKPGPAAIGSAYLDAVDLRDGKTKRFFSNDLVLGVLGVEQPNAPARTRTILLVILGLLLVALAVLAMVRILRRRRPVAEKPNPAAPTTFSAVAPAMSFDEALADMRMRRDRPSVLRVREALWSRAGANQGETLDDVLRREPSRSNGLGRILIAIERATFTRDTQLQQAIEAALSEAERGVAR